MFIDFRFWNEIIILILEMEQGIEDFEKQCWEKINITLRNNEVQEDDSIICDVCRSVSWQIEH